MSLDAFEQIRAGEKEPIYGYAEASSGTLTITGSPRCSLYDSTGTVVASVNNVFCTGYDNTALAKVRVWYVLDTGALSLAAGYYTLVFKFSADGSDTIGRTYEPAVGVWIQPVP